jgi:single-strand DNA-binding protein
MNQITIAGHLGADPEVRFISSGQKVTTLRVAARTRRRNKDETIWWEVTVWGEQFDKIMPYFKKGSPIIVVGELDKPKIFTDRESCPQVSMNITAQNIMFSPFGRPDSQGGGAEGGISSQGGVSSHGQISQQEIPHMPHEMASHTTQDKTKPAFSDDEIPF